MDFTLPPELDDYRRRVRAFVEAHILPLERDAANADEHENLREDVLDTCAPGSRRRVFGRSRCPNRAAGRACR